MNKNPISNNCRELKYGSDLYHKSIELRDKVLRKPLNLQFTKEELAQDKVDHHLAFVVDEEVVGILVLKRVNENTFKMRQVAVDDSIQKSGIGTKLVKFSESFSINKNVHNITLSARDIAVPFYLKLGYKIEGKGFVEVGIAHHTMTKKI